MGGKEEGNYLFGEEEEHICVPNGEEGDVCVLNG